MWTLCFFRRTRQAARLAAALTLTTACASGPDQTVDPNAGGFQFKTPTLVAVSPGEVSLGDAMQVVGQDYVDPMHGSVKVHFHGSFQSSAGDRSDYDGDVPLVYDNPGLAHFEFGPGVIFTPRGDKIGTFTGTADVISHLDDTGEERTSATVPVQITVDPSIYVEQLRSVDTSCPAITPGTIAGTNMMLSMRAIGVAAATDSAPITFRVTFTSPSMNVQYARNQQYNQWPLPPDMPAYQVPAPTGTNAMQATIQSGNALLLNPMSVQTTVSINPPVQIQQDMVNQVRLSRFMTGPVAGAGGADILLFLEASRKGGGYAKRTLTFKAYQEAEVVPWDHVAHIAERYAPQQVSGCFAGGDIGRDLTYTEGTAETQSRSISARWDINASYSAGLNIGSAKSLFGLVTAMFNASWAQTFGTDQSTTVSSETHKSQALTAHILPTYYGVCFRQTERIEKVVTLMYHSPCGVSAEVGKVIMTDWNWGFDIATGRACPPPTNLPPAEKFNEAQ